MTAAVWVWMSFAFRSPRALFRPRRQRVVVPTFMVSAKSARTVAPMSVRTMSGEAQPLNDHAAAVPASLQYFNELDWLPLENWAALDRWCSARLDFVDQHPRSELDTRTTVERTNKLARRLAEARATRLGWPPPEAAT
jgi:hypothetical protein